MTQYIVDQNYENYTEEDHNVWKTLCERQGKLDQGRISRDYLKGFINLEIDREKVVRIEEVSKRLEAISGWTLIPVTGLLPTRDFFYMLINKRYPVTVPIRKPFEIDFSEQPDIFHDICGHLPLLTNEKFTRFLTAYSIIAIKYINHDRAVEFLGRLYWYTYEMGLINEDGQTKPYGGAVITSAEEIENVYKGNIAKYPFDLEHIFKTAYNPFKLQNEYFIINSFDDLFNSLEHLEDTLQRHLLLKEPDLLLRNYSINANLGNGFNNVIGFLNDIQYRYPKATSFVAGQPDENFFDIPDYLSKFDVFVDHMAAKTGRSREHVIKKIGQYNKTKGIVNDIVAEHLRVDENIHVREEDILMTVGAQEAFGIIVSTICDREDDVVLVEDPSYIGVSSFAKIFDYNIKGISTDEEGINLQELKNTLLTLSSMKKRVKLLYVIPDYQNPSGSCMPVGNRLKLLELAERYNFLIIEDSVYNSFTYAQKKNPTLKSLDKFNRVIYVGSFSKSLFPGLRLGLIAADQQIENAFGETVPLIDEMVKVKAQLTNNTPTINQAILGGVLLNLQYSLSEWSKPKFESYKKKQSVMINALDKCIGTQHWATDITWNRPEGGFFIKMTVPFTIDNEAVVECARSYNVIFCPMRYFYLGSGGENEIRLTFSNLSVTEIEHGVKQLSEFLKSMLTATGKTEVSETSIYNY
jgi:(S)-3,5-dihydroxyphenylglycine transaminase